MKFWIKKTCISTEVNRCLCICHNRWKFHGVLEWYFRKKWLTTRWQPNSKLPQFKISDVYAIESGKHWINDHSASSACMSKRLMLVQWFVVIFVIFSECPSNFRCAGKQLCIFHTFCTSTVHFLFILSKIWMHMGFFLVFFLFIVMGFIFIDF